MNPDAIVFDLDGTLWDTSAACAIAWNGVAEREGIAFRQVTVEEIRSVTGLPHPEAVETVYQGLDATSIRRLIQGTESEDNRVISEHGGSIYPGVIEGIPALAWKYRLAIVSNCQVGYIETFLRYSGLEPYFEDWECYGGTRQPKDENLRRVIDRRGYKHPIMIGDSTGDELAARHNRVPFGFMGHGFGRAQSPDWHFEDFAELLATFL